MPSKPNILLIDDNSDITNIVKRGPQADGFNVETYNDPFLALDCFKTYPKKFAFVISDVRMPGMSGIELIANIKKLEPEIKAIFITSFDKDHIKPDLEKYDYDIEIFQKPLAMKEICKRIKRYLNNN